MYGELSLWASSIELVVSSLSHRATDTYGIPFSAGCVEPLASSQQTASSRFAIDCADSTSTISTLSGASYTAAPKSGKPVGWNRVPCMGFSSASMSILGWSSRFCQSITLSGPPCDWVCSIVLVRLAESALRKRPVAAIVKREQERRSQAAALFQSIACARVVGYGP